MGLVDEKQEITRDIVEQSRGSLAGQASGERSEEHTSELQSRQYLVCGLLREKRKSKSEVRRGHSVVDEAQGQESWHFQVPAVLRLAAGGGARRECEDMHGNDARRDARG